MREEILTILKQYGVAKAFYLANGVMSSLSEIHLLGGRKIGNKKYAIQFDTTTRLLVIWDIRKRVEFGASLNLYWSPKNTTWKSLSGCCETYVGIRDSNGRDTGDRSKVVAIPLDALETYLLHNNLGVRIPKNELTEMKHELTSVELKEGGQIQIYGTRYERNPRLRQLAVEIHGYNCAVCGFNFEDKYGEHGKEYIEVHHKKSLSECNGEHTVNPATDMVCLCSNCHRMIHHRGILSVEELRELIKHDNARLKVEI